MDLKKFTVKIAIGVMATILISFGSGALLFGHDAHFGGLYGAGLFGLFLFSIPVAAIIIFIFCLSTINWTKPIGEKSEAEKDLERQLAMLETEQKDQKP